jgi:propionate CoA-transferase
MESRCKAIGRKVALVANYDGFYLDPMVSDAYFSMITYMQNRYYSSASRYTTSAFLRLKLGAALAERNLAPHVFETWTEAQAFSAAQSRAMPPDFRDLGEAKLIEAALSGIFRFAQPHAVQ